MSDNIIMIIALIGIAVYAYIMGIFTGKYCWEEERET